MVRFNAANCFTGASDNIDCSTLSSRKLEISWPEERHTQIKAPKKQRSSLFASILTSVKSNTGHGSKGTSLATLDDGDSTANRQARHSRESKRRTEKQLRQNGDTEMSMKTANSSQSKKSRNLAMGTARRLQTQLHHKPATVIDKPLPVAPEEDKPLPAVPEEDNPHPGSFEFLPPRPLMQRHGSSIHSEVSSTRSRARAAAALHAMQGWTSPRSAPTPISPLAPAHTRFKPKNLAPRDILQLIQSRDTTHQTPAAVIAAIRERVASLASITKRAKSSGLPFDHAKLQKVAWNALPLFGFELSGLTYQLALHCDKQFRPYLYSSSDEEKLYKEFRVKKFDPKLITGWELRGMRGEVSVGPNGELVKKGRDGVPMRMGYRNGSEILELWLVLWRVTQLREYESGGRKVWERRRVHQAIETYVSGKRERRTQRLKHRVREAIEQDIYKAGKRLVLWRPAAYWILGMRDDISQRTQHRLRKVTLGRITSKRLFEKIGDEERMARWAMYQIALDQSRPANRKRMREDQSEGDRWNNKKILIEDEADQESNRQDGLIAEILSMVESEARQQNLDGMEEQGQKEGQTHKEDHADTSNACSNSGVANDNNDDDVQSDAASSYTQDECTPKSEQEINEEDAGDQSQGETKGDEQEPHHAKTFDTPRSSQASSKRYKIKSLATDEDAVDEGWIRFTSSSQHREMDSINHDYRNAIPEKRELAGIAKDKNVSVTKIAEMIGYESDEE